VVCLAALSSITVPYGSIRLDVVGYPGISLGEEYLFIRFGAVRLDGDAGVRSALVGLASLRRLWRG